MLAHELPHDVTWLHAHFIHTPASVARYASLATGLPWSCSAHEGRHFLGIEDCLRLAVGHLAARREGRVDPSEPTGLLTHHLVHDEDAWSFLSAFLQRTKRHEAVHWMDARQLFGCSNDGSA